ncbi:MAG: hypothetical protein Q9202_002346 [Teloschistes flavicans]
MYRIGEINPSHFAGSACHSPFHFLSNVYEIAFELDDFAVYRTGESYAGQYIPYIAKNMLERDDPTYYALKGIQINDPSINHLDTLRSAPAVMYMNHWADLFGLNESFMSDIDQQVNECGHIEFMNNALKFPPTGPLPIAPGSEAINNTIIAHGSLDYGVIANSTLATIQNMTWNGRPRLPIQTKPPSEKNAFTPFGGELADDFVDLLDSEEDAPFIGPAGAGLLGTVHTERGLTYTEVQLAGHLIPAHAPGVAYRHLEFLVWRIGSLEERSGFTVLDPDLYGKL